ncbi:MAG: hypothetical protein N3C12_15310 [Candidatus Binatia bacterium]|nr:hypothetical protein [Candidatus Binatia bacterium]
MAVTYAPAGLVRVGVFGRVVGSGEVELIVYFDGDSVARKKFKAGTELTGDNAFFFTVAVARAGPHSWEFEVRSPGIEPFASVEFRFEKFVITVS